MDLIINIVEWMIALLVLFCLWIFVRVCSKIRTAQKQAYHGYTYSAIGFNVLAGHAHHNQPSLTQEEKKALTAFDTVNKESHLFFDLKRIARHGTNSEIKCQIKELNGLADLNPKMVIGAIGEEGLILIRACRK